MELWLMRYEDLDRKYVPLSLKMWGEGYRAIYTSLSMLTLYYLSVSGPCEDGTGRGTRTHDPLNWSGKLDLNQRLHASKACTLTRLSYSLFLLVLLLHCFGFGILAKIAATLVFVVRPHCAVSLSWLITPTFSKTTLFFGFLQMMLTTQELTLLQLRFQNIP